VLEYVCGGELFGLLHKAKRLTDGAARFYACEILLALEYMHSNEILYRGMGPGVWWRWGRPSWLYHV
jgi:protein kinase A